MDLTLVERNIEILRQGAELLRALDDGTFRTGRGDRAGVGPHLRHCVDFYACFLAGVAGGRLDYDARQREVAVEQDRLTAQRALGRLIWSLRGLAGCDEGRPLLVKVEGTSGPGTRWCASTVGRELSFLLSHTIHHYALVAHVLSEFGFPVPPDFGVAPSTLSYRRARGAAAGQGDGRAAG